MSSSSYEVFETQYTELVWFDEVDVEWVPQFIKLLLDDTVYFTLANTVATPFNNDFFLILNAAMGGSLGG